KWDTFRKALISIWNEDRIKDMLEKLELARKDAEFHILLNLHCMLENSFKNNVEDAKGEIISAIQMLDWTTTSANWERGRTYSASSPQIQERLQSDARKKDDFKRQVFRSLRFSTMTERLEDISEAHKRTFQWVYSHDGENIKWNNFVDWLEHKDGIYWIQGKPGSGKSCLMKNLFDEKRTKTHLRIWSRGRPIVAAGFFFWYAGTDMQKSQNGLLRSILFQILNQQPKLIPVAYSEQWNYYNENGIELAFSNSRKELTTAISRITHHTSFPFSLCLFIDGLDEYNGDHSEIIDLFKDVATTPYTKLCISSRPWPVFTNAFNSCPGLTLQDLTRGDITKYVQARLEESPGMKALKFSEPEEAESLIHEIVDKSCGVFLWTRLVTTSLLSGLTNRDCIADLQLRLEQLPAELEELYIYMLKRIEPFYLTQALRLLYIIQYSRRPLPSLVVSIADEADFDSFINFWPSRLPDEEVTARCEAIEDKIYSRCLGLLECHVQPPPAEITPENPLHDNNSCLNDLLYYCKYTRPTRRVQFMHRTVKEFFDKADVDSEFRTSLHGKTFIFDANETLCFASFVQLQRLFSVSAYGSWASAYRTFWLLINECLYYAAQVEQTNGHAITAILDELAATA
ncbi:hypothetical protein K469DRAFT_454529, partial [Zopfia rhizophila CBS 207.26]